MIKIMDESFGEEKINELAQKVIEVINNAKTETRKKSLIYCMTEEYDNRNLWENYACDYSGFCIEYDFSNAYKQMFDNYNLFITDALLKKKTIFRYCAIF